jgi:hypothetical protein
MSLPGQPKICKVLTGTSSNIPWKQMKKITPKKQKLRKMFEEKVKAVEAEVQRLQDVKVIREVKYPVWLANTVPVKKKKWKMENVCRLHRFEQGMQ